MRAYPVRTEAVLLQQNQSHLRTVGAPAPGANACLPRSHRGGAPTAKPIPPPNRRSARPGCEWGHAWGVDCAGPVRTEAVLLQHNQPHLRTVGAPAPGANGDMHGAWIVLARSHRGGAPTTKPTQPRTVGAPAPGAKGCCPVEA